MKGFRVLKAVAAAATAFTFYAAAQTNAAEFGQNRDYLAADGQCSSGRSGVQGRRRSRRRYRQ